MVIINVQLNCVGMNGKAMVNALARGRHFDPREVVSVEVTVEGSLEGVRDHDAVRRFLAFEATSSFGVSGIGHLALRPQRCLAGPYKVGNWWRVRWEVE